MPGPDLIQALRAKRVERMAPPAAPEAEEQPDEYEAMLADLNSRLEAVEAKLGIAKPQPEAEPEPVALPEQGE